MVWGFKTTLNNQQGLSRTQVTLVQVLCLHHNSKIFQELTQLRLRGHLVSEATPAALCSRCFWRMKWKIFPPWRGWGSSAAPRAPAALTESPRAPGEHSEGLSSSRDRNKHGETKQWPLLSPQKGILEELPQAWSQTSFHPEQHQHLPPFKTRLLICHITHNRHEILAWFDHTLEPMQP